MFLKKILIASHRNKNVCFTVPIYWLIRLIYRQNLPSLLTKHRVCIINNIPAIDVPKPVTISSERYVILFFHQNIYQLNRWIRLARYERFEPAGQTGQTKYAPPIPRQSIG